ncbi:MAG: trimethylamine methyltransferase family protein [Acidobacteria bacterium]|nr:trimethylamine methyltransferase family protein [Acidobacteriota bacterium]
MELLVLNPAEIGKLHSATLDILEEPGIRISHSPMLEQLARAGAKVEPAGGRVRFPRAMVKELLRQAPPIARLTGLNGLVLEVGGENRYYTSLILDPYIIDFEHGPRRPLLEDVRRHTILGESLKHVSGMMRMQYPVADLPEPACYLKTMEVFLSNTTKHVMVYADSVKNAWEWIGAAEILAGSAGLRRTPLLSMAVAITSPLTLHGINAELLEIALAYNLPIIPTVCPMAGTTSPYTVAGTMLMANVETLVPVIVAQALKPGHPVFYMIGPSATDLRTGHDLYYKAEKVLFKTMAAQMGRFYNLPIAGEAAGTMTWRYDPQNGAEGMLYLLGSMAGGQNLFGGLGSCHNANGMSAEQIILQCGMLDMAEYAARGVTLDDDQLGVESIRSAGPGGNFLTDDLTIKNLRGGNFFRTPYYFDYSGGYADSNGAVAMAHETVQQIVAAYKPAVPESVQEDLRRYFSRLTDTQSPSPAGTV